ncbi:MAG: hypothetical protein ACOCVM_08235 [Desulfovibrionaceae bacterium]
MIRRITSLCLALGLLALSAGCCGKDPQSILDKYQGRPVQDILSIDKDLLQTRQATYSFIKKDSTRAKDEGEVYTFELIYEFPGQHCSQETTQVRAVTDPQGVITTISTD